LILKKPKPVQTDRFRLGSVRFLGQKPVQTGLAQFFLVWLGFGLIFSVLARFFGLDRFGSVFSGFFGFRLIKSNRTGQFF
jgi:hypothetical protein